MKTEHANEVLSGNADAVQASGASTNPNAANTGAGSAEPPEPIMQYFGYAHLPEHLQAVSAQFGLLAHFIADNLPRNPERTVALRKLLESKDAAVRARLAK